MRNAMNRVEFRAEELPLPPWSQEARSFILNVLDLLGLSNWDISVLICNNSYIKALNSQYRNKDEPTDVLSFPLGERSRAGRFLAGDIVISLDALEENARFFKVTVEEELRRLLVHGILHLSGEDHATNKADEPMLIKQEEILAKLKENISRRGAEARRTKSD